MPRKLPDWLSSYMQLVEDTESPLQYHVWTGLSAIAGALQRKAWLPFGHHTVYPNMYIVLVGPAAVRKSTSPKIVTKMLRKINVRFTADTATKEALLRALIASRDQFFLPDPNNPGQTKTVVFHHSMSIYSMELSVLLGIGDMEIISWLTDWWDAGDTWGKATVKDGELIVHNICVNLLGLTTADWLVKSIPLDAHSGGFTSRIIFVVGNEKEKLVPLPVLDPAAKDLQKKLTHDLDDIATNCIGEFCLTKQAADYYSQRYVETNTGAVSFTARIAGYMGRRHVHMIKTAMALSASESSNMQIELRHMERADKLLLAIETSLEGAFGAVGKSHLVQEIETVKKAIEAMGVVHKATLLQYFWRDIDSVKMDNIVKTLRDMHLVKVHHDRAKKDFLYQWHSYQP